MELLISGDDAVRRRPSAAALVALALLLVAGGQAVELLRPRALPAAVAVEVLPNGYSYLTEGERVQLGFQLRNSGPVPVEVLDIGAALPGLALADVVASGEPFRFSAVGAGDQPLPAFELPPGTVIEVNLVYRLQACADVPAGERTVPVTVRVGRATGVLGLPVPGAPSGAVDAGPDDLEPWQRVLVRDLCEVP